MLSVLSRSSCTPCIHVDSRQLRLILALVEAAELVRLEEREGLRADQLDEEAVAEIAEVDGMSSR